MLVDRCLLPRYSVACYSKGRAILNRMRSSFQLEGGLVLLTQGVLGLASLGLMSHDSEMAWKSSQP